MHTLLTTYPSIYDIPEKLENESNFSYVMRVTGKSEKDIDHIEDIFGKTTPDEELHKTFQEKWPVLSKALTDINRCFAEIENIGVLKSDPRLLATGYMVIFNYLADEKISAEIKCLCSSHLAQ